jgi:hypothetical protein
MTAIATTSPADLCASAVELASGKFADCRLKAESVFAKTHDSAKRASSLTACSGKFGDAFTRAQLRYGASCPMVDSGTQFDAFVTQCTASTTLAAGGASLPGCGTGAIDSPGEQCDGSDLGGASCSSLGFLGGTLACTGSCTFDTSACVITHCGNGLVDAPEQCDGANLGGQSCTSLGYLGGTLGCSTGCSFDTSGCVSSAAPASGQQSCWDASGTPIACAGTGQDGDTRAGGQLAYVDNGDGTLTDANTGLMWEKLDDDNAGGVHDKDDFYLWTDAFAVKIATLNTAPCFAGHCDWRVPNIKELQSIVDYEVAFPGTTISPAFDTACTPGCVSTSCSCTAPDVYWSSSSYAGSPDFAWYVFFRDGSVLANQKSSSAYVRAVRGGA